MKSGESFDNSAIEKNGIHMEIWEPSHIVLPIPKNSRSDITPVEINVTITNNTSRLFPFFYGRLMPELVNAEGQVLHPKKLNKRQTKASQYDGIGIPPKMSLVCYLIAQLAWSNDFLQLQAAISEPPYISLNPTKSCFFESLKLGIYQLRFTYLSPGGDFSFADSNTGEVNRIEGFKASLLATPWVNFRLVEPVQYNNKNIVEVDGMCFETLVPERSLSIPVTQSIKISVQIGMKITNNTSTPFRFCSFDTLIPELIGANGLIPCQNSGASLGWVTPQESDFQSAQPGECVTLFPKAHLIWQANNLLSLIIPGGGRACWKFNELTFGTYQIQLTYRSLIEKSGVFFENLWMGMVHTPFVEFRLVQR